MKETIESYLIDFANDLHPDVPVDGSEVIVRLRRADLLDFARLVGDIDASALRSEHITRYIATLDERGTDQLSKEIQLSYLRDFCGWLVRAGVLKTNLVPARLCGSWWQRSWIRSAIWLIWPGRT